MNVAHEYLRWEGQRELIDGIPYAASPAPVSRRQNVAGNLHAELRAAIRKAKGACRVYRPPDRKLSNDTVFSPDSSVVCRPITKKFLDFAPEIVEILSDATGVKDRNVKYPTYEAEGVPYYVTADAEKYR